MKQGSVAKLGRRARLRIWFLRECGFDSLQGYVEAPSACGPKDGRRFPKPEGAGSSPAKRTANEAKQVTRKNVDLVIAGSSPVVRTKVL